VNIQDCLEAGCDGGRGAKALDTTVLHSTGSDARVLSPATISSFASCGGSPASVKLDASSGQVRAPQNPRQGAIAQQHHKDVSTSPACFIARATAAG